MIEKNERKMWKKMENKEEMKENKKRIVNGGEGVEVIEIKGKKVIDEVGGMWKVNMGY